jgi:hypothetical protein
LVELEEAAMDGLAAEFVLRRDLEGSHGDCEAQSHTTQRGYVGL